MDASHEPTFEERLSRLERKMEELDGRFQYADAPRPGRRPEPAARPAPRPNPLAAKSLEWWLARGGAILTSLALILLYDYAVERNWITPIVRVLGGAVVGAALMWSAGRIKASSPDVVGLREVLLGAGLSAWYITAYAAAILYQLIPVSAARLVFLALTIFGAWLALSEHRSILGILALGVGFMTPVLLPSRAPFVPAFALYLGALTACGLILYIMRGWLLVLWLTFTAFWWTAGTATELVCCHELSGFSRISGSLQLARIAMTILIVLAGAAMVRTPLLRRRLIATGSDLYTQPQRSAQSESILGAFALRIEKLSGMPAGMDSPAMWIITIVSPLLSVLLLSWIWRGVDGAVWGLASLAIAAVIYRIATASGMDEEFTHVEATAAAIWSLTGLIWLADSIGNSTEQSESFALLAASAHAVMTLAYLRSSKFRAPKAVALATSAVSLAIVIVWEMMLDSLPHAGYETLWTTAELAVIASALWIWWSSRTPENPLSPPSLFGIAAFAAFLFVDARILGNVWPPLVTASFALAGTALLVAGRDRAENVTIRRLGALTLLIVVVRLLLIDLERVETIWRVLLFLGCGALFLFTSHRLQVPRDVQSG
ncbi:MAG TPA: DUF2339 domain-containing protein [Gemmatimonadaceae bacterium]